MFFFSWETCDSIIGGVCIEQDLAGSIQKWCHLHLLGPRGFFILYIKIGDVLYINIFTVEQNNVHLYFICVAICRLCTIVHNNISIYYIYIAVHHIIYNVFVYLITIIYIYIIIDGNCPNQNHRAGRFFD